MKKNQIEEKARRMVMFLTWLLFRDLDEMSFAEVVAFTRAWRRRWTRGWRPGAALGPRASAVESRARAGVGHGVWAGAGPRALAAGPRHWGARAGAPAAVGRRRGAHARASGGRSPSHHRHHRRRSAHRARTSKCSKRSPEQGNDSIRDRGRVRPQRPCGGPHGPHLGCSWVAGAGRALVPGRPRVAGGRARAAPRGLPGPRPGAGAMEPCGGVALPPSSEARCGTVSFKKDTKSCEQGAVILHVVVLEQRCPVLGTLARILRIHVFARNFPRFPRSQLA